MADLYIDLDAGRFVESPSSLAALQDKSFFAGDDGAVNLYFLRQTGETVPYAYEDKSTASVKLAIGSVNGAPTSGTWVLDGSTLDFNATATQLQTALRTSQSDVSLTVSGSIEAGFVVTWGAVGAESLLSANVSNLVPDCEVVVSERRAGTGSVREQQWIKVRTRPAAYQDTFSDISETVVATITTSNGSTTSNETATIALAPVPISGQWTITLPSDTRSVTAAVVAGLFYTTTNHGFAIGQPVVMTGFTNEANFTEGTTYYVESVPSKTSFTISATSGGAAITTATADAGTGTVTTSAATTAALNHNATTADVQAALEALTSIGGDNVAVSGIPGERYDIMFIGEKGLANLPAITASVAGLVGPPGKTAALDLATFGVLDLLGTESSVSASIEVELVESTLTSTVAQATVTLTRDIIDGATVGPMSAPDYLTSLLDSVVSVLELATPTISGLVSTTTQSFSGVKTFIDGLEVDDGNGIVLSSPDTSRWLLTIDDTGQLIRTKL